MNSRHRKLGEMQDFMRLLVAQAVAPVRTIIWLGMEFICSLEKLVCLRVIEFYCLLICGYFTAELKWPCGTAEHVFQLSSVQEL